jgi:NAD(P)-dependent dehydrogenase (short-subunit alcohol dehydrogenase family)
MAEQRVAIVTGGGRGIGRGIAQSLAEAGYALAVWDIDEDLAEKAAKDLESGGVRALAVGCDVSDEDDVSRATQRVLDEMGLPRVLVNNAGVVRRGRIEEIAVSDWDDGMAVNIRGVFLCTRIVGRSMLEARAGSIVNIASVSGAMPQPFFGAYSASKAAVIVFTAQTAVEWGPRGVRCNSIMPGAVWTAASDAVWADPDLQARRLSMVALRRLARPTEIGAMVVFLASDEASFVTGANISVDGGMMHGYIDQMPTVGPDGTLIRKWGTYGDETGESPRAQK